MILGPPGPLHEPPFGQLPPKRISSCFARMLSQTAVVGRLRRRGGVWSLSSATRLLLARRP